MKDDNIKKLRDMLTGSLELMKKKKSQGENENTTPEDLANNFLMQLFNSSWVEDELASNIAPSYTLSRDKKIHWLINSQTKTLAHIRGGIEIIPIEIGEKDSLCLIGQLTYIIPNDLVVYNGWN